MRVSQVFGRVSQRTEFTRMKTKSVYPAVNEPARKKHERATTSDRERNLESDRVENGTRPSPVSLGQLKRRRGSR